MSVAIVARNRGGIAAIESSDRTVRDVENRGMHKARMIPVAFILQNEFPVRLDAVLEEACGDLDLTFRRGANQAVDRLLGAAEVLLQRRAFGGKRAKHEASVGLHAGDVAKPEL